MSSWYQDERTGVGLDPGNLLGYREGGVTWGGVLDPGGSLLYAQTGSDKYSIKTKDHKERFEYKKKEKNLPVYQRRATGPKQTLLTGDEKDRYGKLRGRKHRSRNLLASQTDETGDTLDNGIGTKELENF